MAYLSLTTGIAISTGNRASGVSCRGIVVESVEAQVQVTDLVFASDQILGGDPAEDADNDAPVLHIVRSAHRRL